MSIKGRLRRGEGRREPPTRLDKRKPLPLRVLLDILPPEGMGTQSYSICRNGACGCPEFQMPHDSPKFSYQKNQAHKILKGRPAPPLPNHLRDGGRGSSISFRGKPRAEPSLEDRKQQIAWAMEITFVFWE